MLAATDADADTEEVAVEGAARPKQKFVRKQGESSALSGNCASSTSAFFLLLTFFLENHRFLNMGKA